MPMDSALADRSVERLPVTGPTREALAPLGLPAPLLARAAPLGGVQERTALLLRRGGRVIGFALTVRRPLTAALRLAELWVAETSEAPSLTADLLTAVEELAVEEGAVVIKRAVPADDSSAWDAALAQGFQPMPAPAGAGPLTAEAPTADSLAEETAGAPRGLAKWLRAGPSSTVPYFRQTTDFTCGTAGLCMGLAALGLAEAPARAAEIALWREATTIIAPSGPGGCDTFGLALAARRRGCAPRVHISQSGPILLERAKTEQARDLVRFVQQSFRDEAAASGLPVTYGHFTPAELRTVLEEGGLALVLIDQLGMHQDSCPHWILVHGYCDGVFLAHDPWTDTHLGESWVDGQDLPLPAGSLERIARYGDPFYRSMLVLQRA